MQFPRLERTRSVTPIQPAEILESRLLMTAGLPDAHFNHGLPLTVSMRLGEFIGIGIDGDFTLNDGKILLVGHGYYGPNAPENRPPFMIRLNSDGSTDTSFGQGGYLVASGGGYADIGQVQEAAVQPDGKILILGSSNSQPNVQTIERLNSDGSLDATFGVGGVANLTPPPAGGSNDQTSVQSFNLAPDGKILIDFKQLIPLPTGDRSALMRLNADGSVDSTFGTDAGGVFLLPDGVNIHSIATDTNGIVLGLDGSPTSPYGPLPSVLRLTNSGVVDTRFGNEGNVPLPANLQGVFSLTPDGHGRILVLSSIPDDINPLSVVFRLTENGKIDHAFGQPTNAGFAIIPPSISIIAPLTGFSTLTVQADDSIEFVGVMKPQPDNPAGPKDYVDGLARLTAEGVPDPSYGEGGVVQTSQTPLHYIANLDGHGHARFNAIGATDITHWFVLLTQYNTDNDPVIPDNPSQPIPPVNPIPPVPPDETAPTVIKLSEAALKGRLTSLRLKFSEAMNSKAANTLKAYRLIDAGCDGKLGTKDDIVLRLASARYQTSTNSVVLVPVSKVRTNQKFALVARGKILTDVAGNHLAGKHGVPGSNYVGRFGSK